MNATRTPDLHFSTNGYLMMMQILTILSIETSGSFTPLASFFCLISSE